MEQVDFSLNAVSSLFEKGKQLRYKKGEILIRGGEVPSGIMLLADGHVKAYSLNDRGEENIHLIYRAEEMFPLNWLLLSVIRHTYYEALDPVVVYSLPRDAILSAASQDTKVMNGLLYQTATQLYIYSDRLDNLVGHQDAYTRVVYRILFLAGRFGIKLTDKSIQIEFPVTHQSIADSVNLARETVSRMIERLERKRLVYYQARLLHIVDVESLLAEIDETAAPDGWGLAATDDPPEFLRPTQ